MELAARNLDLLARGIDLLTALTETTNKSAPVLLREGTRPGHSKLVSQQVLRGCGQGASTTSGWPIFRAAIRIFGATYG